METKVMEAYKENPAELLVLENPEQVKERIEGFISDKFREAHAEKGVVGLSGGIDSSVVTTLAVGALGPENVFGIIMPSSTNVTSDQEHAELLANNLKMNYDVIDIGPVLKAFDSCCNYFQTDRSKGNVKARIRMVFLYGKEPAPGKSLVIGTDNRSEGMLGYFTKYGDGGVDINPIGDLYKTQVRQLARHLDIPARIINKAPSAGLWDGQTDEDELGIDYATLDQVLLGFQLEVSHTTIAKSVGVEKSEVRRIYEITDRNSHKNETPPAPRVVDYCQRGLD